MTWVLLHGFTGAPASWDDVVDALAPSDAPLRITLLGHGTASATDDAQTFADEVDRIAAVVEAAGIDAHTPGHLVGYSLGARVAIGLLATHPRLFAHATLISGRLALDDDAARAARIIDDDAWATKLARDGMDAFVGAWEAQPLFASQARVSPARRERAHALRRRHDALGLARAMRRLGLGRMPRYRTDAFGAAPPTTIVVGADDQRFVALVPQLRAALPRTMLRTIVGAGHDVLLEQPAALAALLQEIDR